MSGGNIAIFYFLAQVVERILELIDWILGYVFPKKEKEEKNKKLKMIGMWFLATILSFLLCWMLDLNLMHRLGITNINVWFDKILSALVIGSGTKPIHDLITLMDKGKRIK